MFVQNGRLAYNGSGAAGGPAIPNVGGHPDFIDESARTSERVDSWKEIASHLKRSVRTVTRWEREQGLPVRRHTTGRVYAYKSELDGWWLNRGQQIEQEPPAMPPPSKLKSARIRVLAATAGVLLAAIIGWLTFRSNPKPAPKLLPLTTYPGIEGPPSLSPDGNQVVFVRNGDLFIKNVDDEQDRQLTNTPETEESPAWSPDGRRIAFRRGTSILTVSALGGRETRVMETRPHYVLTQMAWTPDSERLVFSEMTSAVGASLFMVSVASGEKRQLTWPSGQGIGEGWPSVSPDGRTLAFAHYPQNTFPTINVMPMSGGAPRVLTTSGVLLFGLTWNPQGTEIVFSSNRTARLRRIPANPRSPSSPLPLEGAGENARFPSFSQPGNRRPLRLAYQKFDQDFDLRRAELEGADSARQSLKPSRPFLVSTRLEGQLRFSPDGKRIAFVSARSGRAEVWLADGDGTNPVPLTSMTDLNGPRWSFDGQQIGFHAATGRDGKYQIQVVNVAGGPPVRLSQDKDQVDAFPTWSRDGHWIYFASARSGTLQIWKMPRLGGGAVQLTKSGGGIDVRESPDGSAIYYTKVQQAGLGLWRIAAGGGDETKILDTPRSGFWDLTPRGIYFIDFNVPDDAPRPVKFFNFANQKTSQIGVVENSVTTDGPFGFTISPDDRWVVYTSAAGGEADLMLVDNYR